MSVKESIRQTDRVMNKLFIALIVALILAVIGFLFSAIVTATAQESIGQNNSSSRDKQKIIVTWLETNDTKTSSSVPPITVSDKEFWMVFGSILQRANYT